MLSITEDTRFVNGEMNNESTGYEIGHNGGPPLEETSYPDDKGFVAVARSMRSHHLVGFGSLGKYSKAEAWLDLIMECKYRGGTVMNAGRAMEIKPGQLVGAVSWLAARWSWSPREVRTFLDRLQDEGMIERFSPGVVAVEKYDTRQDDAKGRSKTAQQKGKQAQVITICKYSIYQLIRDAARQAKRQASDKHATSTRQASDMNLTKKQGNIETNNVVAHSATTALMIDFVCMHLNVSQAEAKVMLTSNVEIYTAEALAQAFSATLAKMKTATVPAPYQYWLKTAGNIRDTKAKEPAKPATKTEKLKSMLSPEDRALLGDG